MTALADNTVTAAETVTPGLASRVRLIKEEKEPMPQYRRSFIVVLTGEAEAVHEQVFDLCDKDRRRGVLECNLVNGGNRFYKVVIFK